MVASDLQLDYMKLLITQLQNQNPLEPLSNNEMASQLAQFSQLSQLEQMNASFSQVMETTSRDYANSLLGKTVTFYTVDEVTGRITIPGSNEGYVATQGWHKDVGTAVNHLLLLPLSKQFQ